VTAQPQRTATIAALALGCAAVTAVCAVMLASTWMDDPYIFARYAKNLLSGHDLVWNLGEPRVEGISSWLWLGVQCVGLLLGRDPVGFARVIGILCAAALTGSFAAVIVRLRGHPAAGAVALVSVVGAPAIPYYASCGMDQIAWALIAWLFLLWVARSGRVRPVHGLAAAAGILVRPEGFLLFVPLLVLALRWPEGWAGTPSGAPAFPRRLRPILPGLGLFAALLIVRRLLFDAWLPNAAASKHLGGSLVLRALDGAVYAAPSVATSLGIPAACGLVAWAAGRATRMDGARALAAASGAFCASLAGFVIVAGGDDRGAFGDGRLLLAAIVPMSLVLAVSLGTLLAENGTRRAAAAALTVVLLLGRAGEAKTIVQQATGATNLSGARDLATAWSAAFRPAPMSPLSSYFLERTPAGESIAIPWAGLIPYQTGLPVIDLLGLNDRIIGSTPVHGRALPGQRYDPDEVFRRRPAVLCDNFKVRQPIGELADLTDESLRAVGASSDGQRRLLRDPRLAAGYVVDWEAPTAGTCFVRIDLAGPRP